MASHSTWRNSSFSAVQPPFFETPGVHVAATHKHVRHWKITHACEAGELVLPLAEAQTEAGMRPAVLTASGWFNNAEASAVTARVSLIHAWREVRQWRGLYAEEGIGAHGEILHAHCFSAAMAAVRAGVCMVYDFSAPVGSGGGGGPWLTKSLRVAEGFALTRADAVVVHTQHMWDAAVAQGVAAEDLFLVPEHVILPAFERDESSWLEEMLGVRPAVTLFAASDSDVDLVLRAFSVLAEEVEGAYLVVENPDATAVTRQASALGIASQVQVVSSHHRPRVIACADIVIAGAVSEGPNPLAVEALAHGRALLAADVAANREVTPHGRGCLWYAPNTERELAFRAAFLARNADFRCSLGSSGRTHIQTTRGAATIAQRYDEVYRHAVTRHRGGPDLRYRAPAFALCC